MKADRSLPTLIVVVATLTSGCGTGPARAPVDLFLQDAWAAYKTSYIRPEGFVLDPRRDGGAVTSEGQGYGLLRAVWERDEVTFRRLFDWTESTLRRPDGLYSWLWVPEGGGRIADPNTATDADQEIAFALAMACAAFRAPEYGRRAAELVRAVREHTGIQVSGHWFPSAGNWARGGRIVNLSYFVPYAHPWFDRLDPEGDWPRVADVGYDLIERATAPTDALLVPDFMSVDDDGAPRRPDADEPLSTDFSFDAVRLFWRIEADCALTGRPRACGDPLGLEVLAEEAFADRIVTRYRTDGVPLSEDRSTSFPAAVLPAARRSAPALAERLDEAWSTGGMRTLLAAPDRYYDHNWVWFGLALDSGLIAARTPEPGSCRWEESAGR